MNWCCRTILVPWPRCSTDLTRLLGEFQGLDEGPPLEEGAAAPWGPGHVCVWGRGAGCTMTTSRAAGAGPFCMPGQAAAHLQSQLPSIGAVVVNGWTIMMSSCRAAIASLAVMPPGDG